MDFYARPQIGRKSRKRAIFLHLRGSKPRTRLALHLFSDLPEGLYPAVKMPCLKIIGQDAVCYSLIKADGKVLELSQIGGTGNTNRYVRKK